MRNILKKALVVGLALAICAGSVLPVMAKTTTCKESKCKNDAVSGSDYCSIHKCGVSSCKDKAKTKGYCYSHQSKTSRDKANKDAKSSNNSKTCELNSCNSTKAYKSSYCSKHTCKKSNCYNQKKASASYCSKHIKSSMPDCDDYDSYDDFMDDWDGCMPDGSDAEDYWYNW